MSQTGAVLTSQNSQAGREMSYSVMFQATVDPFALLLKWRYQDFPGGPVFKNPPCNAKHRDLIPGGRAKIPHAMRQLSSCAAMKTQHSQKKKKKKRDSIHILQNSLFKVCSLWSLLHSHSRLYNSQDRITITTIY